MNTFQYSTNWVQQQVQSELLRVEITRKDKIHACVLKAWCATEQDLVTAIADAKSRGVKVMQEWQALHPREQGMGIALFAFIIALVVVVGLMLAWGTDVSQWGSKLNEVVCYLDANGAAIVLQSRQRVEMLP